MLLLESAMVIYSEFDTLSMDVAVDFVGYEDCKSLQDFGPAIRDNYVLHYISSGSGYFHYKKEKIFLKKGDLFLLKKNELTYYQADKDEPWSYYWIGINGNRIKDYLSLSRIHEISYIKSPDTCDTKKLGSIIKSMVEDSESIDDHNLKLLKLIGQSYEVLYELIRIGPQNNKKSVSSRTQICLDCRRIIETQYNKADLSIQDIASQLNVNRTYLTRIFKEYTSMSPKQYLQEIRMKRASQLLENTKESVKVIAYSVGFKDPLYFSKAFKEFYDKSPSDYR